MLQGERFLPIDVFLDPATGEMWRADGEHRTWACEINRESHVLANVHSGTRRDALDFALKCDLGLPRNEDDKELCIRQRLEDPEWSKRSDRLIALQFGIDHKTVGNIRRQLGVPQPETRIGADGKVRKAPTSTGEIPQLASRKSKGQESDSGGQMQSVVPQKLESPAEPPSNRQADAIRLIESILGDSKPAIMEEICDHIRGPLGADASVDAVTMVAHALAWGFDSLSNADESWRYKRTPRQCYSIIKEASAMASATSRNLSSEGHGNSSDMLLRNPETLPSRKAHARQENMEGKPQSIAGDVTQVRVTRRDVPCSPAFVEYIQQVMGATTLSPEEINSALKSLGLSPSASDPVSYIRMLLSANRTIFLRSKDRPGYVYLAESNPYRRNNSVATNDHD